ncbi:MAG: ribonuclease HII [Firmicutes bacterium]|jgi:ribonuclease HII|uniref:Ribonuclease HII n=1 Tax=Sulfobacillus benefaciens TaxID=453960 RepID=A0A2T2XAG9_9FIRM|nr:ribonuclease HII [Bacillota bacterium]MCL5014379.1 ribonuclease HII [Bacillota bacterium]PSR31482.1 MAG: ribonuclease HII [Sulfobacillus benefaciens]
MPNSHISQLQCWIEKTHWEKEFWDKGWSVAGTDEAGRGPLAGPVVAAAVVLNPQRQILGVDDSKRLSVSTREHLYEEICRQAWAIGVGVVGPRTIEKINILEASRMAMIRALSYLNGVPRVVLTDAMAIGGPWDEYPLIHGDQISASIGAASIIAKVVRDRYMTVLARQYPAYGFERHKGYPTPYHRAMIVKYGPCAAHRRTFLGKILPRANHDVMGIF